jgi:hypothetical protein
VLKIEALDIKPGASFIVDTATRRQREEYERQVVDMLQDAGVVDAGPGTLLAHLDRDKCEFAKCEFALMRLEALYSVRLRRDYLSVAEVAGELYKALNVH